MIKWENDNNNNRWTLRIANIIIIIPCGDFYICCLSAIFLMLHLCYLCWSLSETFATLHLTFSLSLSLLHSLCLLLLSWSHRHRLALHFTLFAFVWFIRYFVCQPKAICNNYERRNSINTHIGATTCWITVDKYIYQRRIKEVTSQQKQFPERANQGARDPSRISRFSRGSPMTVLGCSRIHRNLYLALIYPCISK